MLHMAWRNLWRNRRRTLLTITGIGFSCFLFVFATPVQFGAFDSMVDLSLRLFVGHAQIQKKGYNDNPQLWNAIDDAGALAQRVRDMDKFSAVSVRAMGFALVSSRQRSYGAQIMGVEPEHEPNVSSIPSMINQGRYLSDTKAHEVVIGSALARNLKIGLGDELTILGSGKDGSMAATILPVVGIFDSGDPALDRFMVEIPLHTFQQLFNMGNSANTIVVSAKSNQDRDLVPQELKRLLADRPDLVVLDWQQLLPGLKETWDLKKIGGLIFMLILTVVVVFSIFNTFLMAVLERTKEFGLMLALGAKPSSIISMGMTESLLLSLFGLALGLVIALPLDIYLSMKGFMYPGMAEILEQYNLPLQAIFPQINLFNILLGPSIIFVTTNLAAWIPLRHIRRLRPVDAMRTV
jgi:ABC-type lipoprotein release transport system permease subunit